jgi:hypothetical protein
MATANKALLAALGVIAYGTQPDRMLVVRMKQAFPSDRFESRLQEDFTIVPKSGKLVVYYMELVQGIHRRQFGIGTANWNRAPTNANTHAIGHTASTPQAAFDFLTLPSEVSPRRIPTEIRLLRVDRLYKSDKTNAQRQNNGRRAATTVQAAWRGMVGRRKATVQKTRAAHKLVGNTIKMLPPMGRKNNASYVFPGGVDYHKGLLRWHKS